MRLKHVGWFAYLLAVISCGPNPKPPVKVMVLATAGSVLDTRQVELNTITNLTGFQGTAVKFMGAARVRWDSSDPLQSGVENLSDTARYDAVVKDRGVIPRGNFIDKAGVLWPGDFHTWNMASTYFNFEQSLQYFADQFGADAPVLGDLKGMPLLYFPEYYDGDQTKPLNDNMLWVSPLQSFVFLPFKDYQRVPFGMNLGVVGHEFAHRVFQVQALAKEGWHPVLPPRGGAWSGKAFNLLKSIDEGFADFHGWSVTCGDQGGCQTNFVAASLDPEAPFTKSRSLGRNDACMTEGLKTQFETAAPLQWLGESQYNYGSIWANALVQAGLKYSSTSGGSSGLATIRKGLLNAYNNGGKSQLDLKRLIEQNVNTPNKFTPEAVANIIVDNMGNDMALRKILCEELITRLWLAHQLSTAAGSNADNSCLSFPCMLDGPQLTACPTSTARLNNKNFCPFTDQVTQ